MISISTLRRSSLERCLMSFSFGRNEKDRAATRFMAHLHASLAHAAVAVKGKTGLTQRKLADDLSMDKAAVSRILSGRGNPTARTIGELCWALGVEPELVLHPRGYEKNHASLAPVSAAPVQAAQPKVRIKVGTTVTTQTYTTAPHVAWAA